MGIRSCVFLSEITWHSLFTCVLPLPGWTDCEWAQHKDGDKYYDISHSIPQINVPVQTVLEIGTAKTILKTIHFTEWNISQYQSSTENLGYFNFVFDCNISTTSTATFSEYSLDDQTSQYTIIKHHNILSSNITIYYHQTSQYTIIKHHNILSHSIPGTVFELLHLLGTK